MAGRTVLSPTRLPPIVPVDPSDDDDPFEDPFAGDPLEDPFAEDSHGDPLEDPFAGDDGDVADEDVQSALTDTPRETLVAFVTVAILVHGGLFAASLGAMLVGFRGQWTVGGGLLVGGVGALALAVVRYRWFRAGQE